jgi:hypothetical protein
VSVCVCVCVCVCTLCPKYVVGVVAVGVCVLLPRALVKAHALIPPFKAMFLARERTFDKG